MNTTTKSAQFTKGIVGACNAYPALVEALQYMVHLAGNENTPGNILKLLDEQQ